jgi:putative ABC transport system ATP-binding protein
MNKGGREMENIIKATNIIKEFAIGDLTTRVLDNVSLEIEEGEFVSIMGPSGSGKSTLLYLLGGLDKPTDGQVIIAGKDISKLKDEELTIFRRRHIGFVFQNYNLVPILNVYENIVLPIELDGNKPDQDYIDKIISLLGLKEKLNSMSNNLSGGQQQRVAIASALATKPAINTAIPKIVFRINLINLFTSNLVIILASP